MSIRLTVSVFAALLGVCVTIAQEKPEVKKTPIHQTSPASGKEMFTHYCAACHGGDAKGSGPAAPSLKTAPPDLTTLAKRHDGKYPADYVANLLQHGPATSAHGSSDMPTWGPLFRSLDPNHEIIVQQRIKNLNDYLMSLQAK
jgi:mono/diheme cytochrome c family protein